MVNHPNRSQAKISRDKLSKIKAYLEEINFINHGVKEDLVKEWNDVYSIVYEALNDFPRPSLNG